MNDQLILIGSILGIALWAASLYAAYRIGHEGSKAEERLSLRQYDSLRAEEFEKGKMLGIAMGNSRKWQPRDARGHFSPLPATDDGNE